MSILFFKMSLDVNLDIFNQQETGVGRDEVVCCCVKPGLVSQLKARMIRVQKAPAVDPFSPGSS